MEGNVYAEIGVVLPEPLFVVTGMKGGKVIEENIYELKEAWQKTLRF